jgi:hypothetical protein
VIAIVKPANRTATHAIPVLGEPSRVSFVLRTVSGGVVNGVWRAQQLKGTYKVVQGPDSCNNYTSSSGVYDLSTQPF